MVPIHENFEFSIFQTASKDYLYNLGAVAANVRRVGGGSLKL